MIAEEVMDLSETEDLADFYEEYFELLELEYD